MNFNFQIKIERICPEKTLISNLFQFCQNALKTKISLEVHFRKNGFRRVFVTFSHMEKKQNFSESCSWQVYVKERMWRVNYFSSMLNYGRKMLILNIVIPPLQFQKYFFQRNFMRQKSSTRLLRLTGKTDFGRSQFVASKIILEFFLAFRIFTAISAAPKEQS